MTKISTRQTGRVLLNSTRPQRNGLAMGERASAKLYTVMVDKVKNITFRHPSDAGGN